MRKSTSEDESEEVRKMQVSWLRCGWVGSMLTMVIRIRAENWSLTCASCFLGCWDVFLFSPIEQHIHGFHTTEYQVVA